MNLKIRHSLATFLLLATAVITFGLPRPRYQSLDIIRQLNIPTRLPDWRSKDMKEELNLEGDDRYRFIGDVFARLYGTRYGDQVLFLILDVNNFHPPTDCFTSSGFQIDELKNPEFQLQDRTLTPKAFYARKAGKGFLVIHWITMDKKMINNWTYGEIQQLFFNLLNRKRAGLMMRMDIPIDEEAAAKSLQIAEKFIKDLKAAMSEDDANWILGMIEER